MPEHHPPTRTPLRIFQVHESSMADVTMAMYTHIEAEIFLPIADLKDAIRAQTQLPDHLWYQTKCEDALAQVMQLLADLDAGWRHP